MSRGSATTAWSIEATLPCQRSLQVDSSKGKWRLGLHFHVCGSQIGRNGSTPHAAAQTESFPRFVVAEGGLKQANVQEKADEHIRVNSSPGTTAKILGPDFPKWKTCFFPGEVSHIQQLESAESTPCVRSLASGLVKEEEKAKHQRA